MGDFEGKRRFPEKGPRSAIESGRVLRTTRKSDTVFEKVVRVWFEINQSRESRKAGLRGRFRRDETIENASQRRIITQGTSNEAKRRPIRSEIGDFRKRTRRNRSAVRRHESSAESRARGNFATRFDPAEELAAEAGTAISSKMAASLLVQQKTRLECRKKTSPCICDGVLEHTIDVL